MIFSFLNKNFSKNVLIPGGLVLLASLILRFFPEFAIGSAVISGVGLFFLALSANLEMFLLFSSLAVLMGCSFFKQPFLLGFYAGCVFLPCLAVNIYLKILSIRPEFKEKVSIFNFLIPVFSFVVFFLNAFWPVKTFSEAQSSPYFFFVNAFPGISIFLSANFLFWSILCWAKRFSYERDKHFDVSAFNYWWLCFCQAGWIFSDYPDFASFQNFFIVALLPFSLAGLFLFWNFIQKYTVKDYWLFFYGFLGVAAIAPVIFLCLGYLFKPWIDYFLKKDKGRKIKNGNH